MTPERVWAGDPGRVRLSDDDDVRDRGDRRRGARGARRRCAAGRRRHRSRRRRAPGQGAAAGEPRRDPPHRRSCAGSTETRRALRSARWSRTRSSRRTRSFATRYTALADASAIVGSHATRAHGTLGGNLMNASPAMETGGPLMCFDATRDAPRRRRELARSRSPTSSPGPGTTVPQPDELLVAVELPPVARADGQRLRAARVPPPDGDRRRRRDRGRDARRRTGRRAPGSRSRRSRRRSGASRRPRRRSSGADAEADAVEAAAAAAAGASRRSPTSAPRSATGGRWPR